MSDNASRVRLARAAVKLAAGSALPRLILVTDDERLPDPVLAARALPRGAAVIVRAKDAKRRRVLAKSLREIARVRGLFLIVAGDAALARAVGADGVHLAEVRIGEAAALRARGWKLITVAAHSLAPLRKASGVDALILSAVFATQSHPEKAALGAARANLMARLCPKPVYALGGVTAQNAARLHGFCGIAAIGALKVTCVFPDL